MFEKSSWIWENNNPQQDEYAEFLVNVKKQQNKKYTFNISVDSNYCAEIDGKIISFGQYSDYPTKKSYNSVDITELLKDGKNEIKITAYFFGASKYGVYAKGEAGLLFEILENESIIAFSCEDTISRISPAYASHKCEELTFILGYKFDYTINAPETPYSKSVIRNLSKNLIPRPNKMLVLKDRVPSKILKYGTYVFGEGKNLGERMHSSTLTENATLSNGVLSGNGNVFFIVELDKEHSGFLSLDIELEKDTDIFIGYDEHITDGVCRTINGLDYTCTLHAKAGKNVFLEKFRRFGCRYIQMFIPASTVKINYLGLQPTEYPISFKPFNSGNELQNKIYQVAEHTLRCNMHEHYEDSCCREQALYSLDSRNEMLFTYYSTGDYEFARSCLSLINQGMNPHAGLLRLTYPSYDKIIIPSYSPSFFLSSREYIQHSGDTSLATEVYENLNTMTNRFLSKMDERGVICNFSDEPETELVRYWDFFDWTDSMHDDPHCFDYEAPLNAWLSLALESFAYICRVLGKNEQADDLIKTRDKLNKSIVDVFFEKDTGLFKSFENKNHGKYSVYTQSLCMLCGAAALVDTDNILKVLTTNGKDNLGLNIDADTLGTCCFRYDALLQIDKQKYKELILSDIDSTYSPMLDWGATTFWETALGLDDPMMNGTESLCHAWSSAPLMYYRKLILGETI